MKKFVAIVIALVMVLSMTSAFAITLDCETLTFDWTCVAKDINCGKAVVEVVPYVHVNADCDGDEYVVNDCATAIKGENVYFAIKLTVDADPDPDFFNSTGKVVLNTKGIENGWDKKAVGWAGVDLTATATEQEVYYYNGSVWVNAEDVEEFNLSTVIFGRKVLKAADAEVCATLESYNNGKGEFVYGDYTIDTTYAGENGAIAIKKNPGKPNYEWAEYVTVGGVIDSITKSSNEFLAEANAFLNLGCAYGVCINDDNIEAIFGWDYEQKDCFDWSTKGASVVNPECSVEIPKTGDVSVVAYAVMAIAAAAGMLKK